MATPKRPASLGKPVGIGPLVFFDFFFGGIALVGGVAFMNMSGGGGPITAVTVGLAIFFLLMGMGMVVMGALLFTRQMWAYYLAFSGHMILFVLQCIGFLMTIVQASNARGGAPGSGGNNYGGICGMVLVGACAHHAWKLIQQEKAKIAGSAAGRDRLETADDPEIDANPGWDEGPAKKG